MKIALLEDDPNFAEMVTEWLQDAGYEVTRFENGLDFIREHVNDRYDLCIFDWMLKDMQGPDVMASIKLRTKKVPPIIFLTGRSEEQDIVRVIESGADDYVVKPSTAAILLARIHAVLRRVKGYQQEQSIFKFADLQFDVKRRVVTLREEEISLTDKEFDLAYYFLRNEGALLSRPHLMQVVWGASSELETRKVDVHISHLRTKLKLTPEYGWKLTSIYQQGYRLERK